MNETAEPRDSSLPSASQSQPLLQDRYQILEVIGEGTFTTTYLALDRKSDTRCVIKALSMRMVETFKAKELFEREAKILSALDHPQIPKFKDYFVAGAADNLKAYLVQEYIQGENLAQALKRGTRFTEADAMQIALNVTQILAYLQSFSPPIIHRDIKPSNLIVGADKKIYLIDFGAVRDKVILEPLMKGEGPTIVGTYGYMPLEQFEGRAVPASDIYSLGATLVHLLSLKEPWEMEKTAMRIDFEPHTNVSRPFASVLKKMLEPDSTKRYQSAADLQQALLRVVTPAEEKKPRIGRTAAALLIVGAIGTLLIGLWRSDTTVNQRRHIFTQRLTKPVVDAVPAGAILRLGTSRMKHGWTVFGVTFSPSGKLVASGGEDQTASVWDAQTGAELHRFPHWGDVRAVAFSPDEKRLAVSGGRDTTIRIWDLETGTPLLRLQGPLRTSRYSPIRYPIAYSPDGKTLASLGLDSTLQLWDAESGKPLQTIKAADKRIEFFAFSPDGKNIISLTREGTISLIEIASGRILSSNKLRSSLVSAAFSPDGKLVATGNYSSISVHDVSSGKELYGLSSPANVYALTFSNDGKTFAASGANSIAVWNLENRSIIAEMPGHHGTVTTLSFSPDGQTLASSGYDNVVRLWDLRTQREVTAVSGHAAPVNCVSFSTDGKVLISGSVDKTTRHWDVASGKEILAQTWEGPVGYASQFSPNRMLIAESARYHVIDSYTKWEVAEVPLEKGGAAFAHSPTEEKFAAGSQSGIEIRNTTSGKIILRITESDGRETKALAFSPDGSTLVSVKGDTSISMWDAATGKQLYRIDRKAERFNTQHYVSFTADGKYLVSGGLSATIWEVRPDRKLRYASEVRGGGICTLSPDGKLLATRDLDVPSAIRLYSLTTTPEKYTYFRRMARLKGHRGGVQALAFSPGNRILASGGSDGAVVLWDLQKDWEKEEADFLRPDAARNINDKPVLELKFDGTLSGPGILRTHLAEQSDVARFVLGKKGSAILLKKGLDFPETESILLRDSFTVQFWFQLERADLEHIYVMDSHLIVFDVRKGKPLVFGLFRDRGGHTSIDLEQYIGKIEPVRWYHLAVVHDRFQSQLSVYVDGKIVHSGTENNLSHEIGMLQLGDQTFERAQYPEIIDEFRIYSYARTAEQIAADALVK